MLEFGMDIGVKVNSMQAFVLARKGYRSGSPLYFVRDSTFRKNFLPRNKICARTTRNSEISK